MDRCRVRNSSSRSNSHSRVGNSHSRVSNSVSNYRCMGNQRSSSNQRSLVGRGVRVGSNTIICDISHIAIISIRVVVHMLGAAIRESHGVGACNIASTISILSSIEFGTGIVIRNSILISVRSRLFRVGWSSMGNNLCNWGNHRGSMNNRGMSEDWSSLKGMRKNRGSMHSMRKNRGSMKKGCSMGDSRVSHSSPMNYRGDDGSIANCYWFGSSSSRLYNLSKSLGVVHLRGGAMQGSKSLGLNQAPHLLTRAGH
jgi:hypothetical protein